MMSLMKTWSLVFGIVIVVAYQSAAHAYNSYDMQHSSTCYLSGIGGVNPQERGSWKFTGGSFSCNESLSEFSGCQAICPISQMLNQWPSKLDFINIYYKQQGSGAEVRPTVFLCAVHTETGAEFCTSGVAFSPNGITVIGRNTNNFGYFKNLDWHYALYLKIWGTFNDKFYGYKPFWTLPK